MVTARPEWYLLGGLLLLLLLGICVFLLFCRGFLHLGFFLDSDEQADDVLAGDHVILINLELSEDVVNLSLGHLVSPGLKSMLKHLGVDLAAVVVSLEGLDDQVVGVVAITGHLLLEHGDHGVGGAGAANLSQESVKEEPKVEEAPVVEEAPAEEEEDADAKK